MFSIGCNKYLVSAWVCVVAVIIPISYRVRNYWGRVSNSTNQKRESTVSWLLIGRNLIPFPENFVLYTGGGPDFTIKFLQWTQANDREIVIEVGSPFSVTVKTWVLR